MLYIYSSNPCAFDKRNVSNECMCKPYYWQNFTSKNGSKVGELRQCHCGYFENVKEKTCQCPTWNGYLTDGTSCGCPEGYEEILGSCEEESHPWTIVWIVIVSLIGTLLVIAGIVWTVKKRRRANLNQA